jgi:hypothetical protein
MAITSTISAHDNIPQTIVLHGLPFLWHIQQVLPTVPQPFTYTRSSSDVFCLPGAVPWAQALGAGFSSLKPRFNRSNANMEIVVNLTMGKVFLCIYFGFPLSVSFHQCFSRIFSCHPHYINLCNWQRRHTTHLTNLSLSYDIRRLKRCTRAVT